ncbi:unnamed protein product [Auanema sp. JU1783]|nr:unnamed protein product [Auanema sp. JU1783]
MNSKLLFICALLVASEAFSIDTGDYLDSQPAEYALPKRNFQHIWRNIEMQMPNMQNTKRTESLSRARANAYYRLG